MKTIHSEMIRYSDHFFSCARPFTSRLARSITRKTDVPGTLTAKVYAVRQIYTLCILLTAGTLNRNDANVPHSLSLSPIDVAHKFIFAPPCIDYRSSMASTFLPLRIFRWIAWVSGRWLFFRERLWKLIQFSMSAIWTRIVIPGNIVVVPPVALLFSSSICTCHAVSKTHGGWNFCHVLRSIRERTSVLIFIPSLWFSLSPFFAFIYFLNFEHSLSNANRDTKVVCQVRRRRTWFLAKATNNARIIQRTIFFKIIFYSEQ